MQIEEANKIIAEFMGLMYDETNKRVFVNDESSYFGHNHALFTNSLDALVQPCKKKGVVLQINFPKGLVTILKHGLNKADDIERAILTCANGVVKNAH